MNDTAITYGNLFTLLASLGFQEKRPGKAPAEPRVFFHEQTDTILAFHRASEEFVTPADMLSTEVHLHGKGIVERSLQSLVGTIPLDSR